MKKSVVSLILVIAACPALPAELSVDRLVGCSDIRDARDRLACFDREVAPFAKGRPSVPAPPVARAPVTSAPATQVAPSAPARAATAAPTATAATPSAFGDDQLGVNSKKSVPEEERTLHAAITSIRPAGTGTWLVTLDNGQVWRHQDATQGAYLREGDAVTLTRASLGSYRLARDAGQAKNWIRATRIR
jgi:hypothetical protein